MKLTYYHKLYFILFLLGSLLFSSCSSEKKPILIATAANMQYTVEEIATAFTLETGIKCETIISSSGKLTAQIKEGAPFDVFISADTKYPEELFKSGFTENNPKIYAYGNLILWSLVENMPIAIDSLTTNNIKHIAMASPQTAPYGFAAEEVLKYYGIYDSVKLKLVVGESIGQTNQFIMSKAAEVGFTSKSTVMSTTSKGKGSYIDIDKKAHSPIAQSAVVLKNTKNNLSESQKFFNFLFSKKGKEILKKNGYTVVDNE